MIEKSTNKNENKTEKILSVTYCHSNILNFGKN